MFIANRLPTPVLQNISPFQKLLDRVPNYRILRTYGCLCFPLIPKATRSKLDTTSRPSCFIGYANEHKGYKCLDPISGKIVISRHVLFKEGTMPFHLRQSTDQTNTDSEELFRSLQIIPGIPENPQTSRPNNLVNPVVAQTTPEISNIPAPPTVSFGSGLVHESSSTKASLPVRNTVDSSTYPPTGTPKRLKRTTRPSIRLKDYVVDLPKEAHLSEVSDFRGSSDIQHIREPRTVREAVFDPLWVAAMEDEIEALARNDTWDLVRPSTNINVVGCRWVFRLKENSDGSIERRKARLVAKGFHQREGQDFDLTYSPVAKASTIRTILALSMTKGWPLHHLDVCNAFLNGKLTEVVYMRQPPAFANKQFPDQVCRLKKALYGLKQAPREWCRRLSTFLERIGFIISSAESSLFVRRFGLQFVYVLVYVDDFIITGSHPVEIKSFIRTVCNEFQCRHLGSLSYFLGLEARNANGNLLITQRKYSIGLLQKFGLLESKSVATPEAPGKHLSKQGGETFDDPQSF